MGKRNKKSRASSALEAEGGMPRPQRREILELVNVLLEKCSTPSLTKGEEWVEFVEIHELVQKIRKKQTNYVFPPYDRERCFPDFVAWLHQNGVNTDSVAIEKYQLEDYGLKATKDINASDLVLTIPRKTMITTENAKTSILGPIIKEDKILKVMPNVVLALYLLCERNSASSFWAPYIRILPSMYSTPLYFSVEEFQLLKGSPTFAEAINQYRSIARQYAYFFKLFQVFAESHKLPIKNMCFDDYRWAVSTVMTRQNQVPNAHGVQNIVSLIPLWDMCNHTNGHITTDFDLKKDCSQSYALRDFKIGEQIFIFYGNRSNADLMIHNGFVYEDNQYDRLSVKLGISKNDHLFAMKSELLARLSLSAWNFAFHAGSDPIDSNTLGYLRVFCMDQKELADRLMGDGAKKLVNRLRDFGLFVSVNNEKKCWRFLETRAQLLLSSYSTTIKEDEDLLKKKADSLSDCAKMIMQLRLGEKHILQTTMEYANVQREEVDTLLQQHLQDMQLGMNMKDLELGFNQDDNDEDNLNDLKLIDQEFIPSSEVKVTDPMAEIRTAAISSPTEDSNIDGSNTSSQVSEGTVEQASEQKVEQSLEQKVEHSSEQKVQQLSEQKVQQSSEQKVEQSAEQKVEQSAEQKVEQSASEQCINVTNGVPESLSKDSSVEVASDSVPNTQEQNESQTPTAAATAAENQSDIAPSCCATEAKSSSQVNGNIITSTSVALSETDMNEID